MKYKILVTLKDVIEVPANSEEEAIALLKQNLIDNDRAKPTDPIDFEIIQEVTE